MDSIAFDFITDEVFRASLEADYAELRGCAESKAWKAVHVLAGSIVEAVLVDYLIGVGYKESDPLQMGLAQLITAAKKAGALSQRTADLSSAVKSYRNLIHPGRAKRLGEVADADGANVAEALVSIIVREVATKHAESYGLTAEQLARKIETDQSAMAVAEHLISEASAKELERLLMKVIPDRYFAEASEMLPDEHVLARYGTLYRIAYAHASKALRARVMKRYVKVLKEESGTRVTAFEERFFEASHIHDVQAEDRGLVKDHLLARLREAPSERLLAAAEGIGGWLQAKDVEVFVDALVRASIHGDFGVAALAQKRLRDESIYTPPALDQQISERLDAWIRGLDDAGNDELRAIVQDAREGYAVFLGTLDSGEVA